MLSTKKTNALWGSNKRSSLIRKNIIASFVIKGWSVLVQLMLVPTTLACVGVYENGVWLTISSVLLWIDNMDIGLGNGLRNKLAVAMALNDEQKARQLVSSTFAMLILIIIPTLLVLLLLIFASDNYQIFNVDRAIVGNLDAILIVSAIMTCSTFVFKFIGNFYMGMQLPAISNLIVVIGNTLALIATSILYLCNIHSLFYIALVNTAAPLTAYLISYPITFYLRYPKLRPTINNVKFHAIKNLFSLGIRFFVLQLSGIVLFFSSNLIISNMFSPSMVTPYQIINRYFMVLTILFTVIGGPYWSATTDAFAKKDIAWIRKSNRDMNYLMVLLAALVICMILASSWVYNIWIGDKVYIPISMTVIGGLYHFILIWSTRYSFILNGIGALRLQLTMTIIASIIYVPLAVYVSKQTYNINWLMLVMCIVNIPGLIVNAIQYKKIINGNAVGTWRK